MQIAKFQVLPNANFDVCGFDVIVTDDSGWFYVHINGGLLADGSEQFSTTDLGAALARAAREVQLAIEETM